MPVLDLVQFRKGTASQWTSANPVLANGEPGWETDTGKLKVGTGAGAWNALPYQGGSTTVVGGEGVAIVPDVTADGTTDDRAALQAAINNAPAGSMIQLPPGRMAVSAPIIIDKQGLTLQGAATGARGNASQNSPGSTIVARAGFSGAAVLIVRESASSVNPLHGVTVRDLTIDGADLGTGVHGIWWRSHTSLLEHVHVYRATGDGILVQGYTVEERVAAGIAGATDWSTYELVISNVVVGRCAAGAGVRFGPASADGKLSDSTLFDNVNNLVVEGSSQQVASVHTYSAVQRNVISRGGSRTKIVGLKCEGAQMEGLWFDGTTGGSSDIQVVGSQFADNSRAGGGLYSHIAFTGTNAQSRVSLTDLDISRKGGTTVLAQYGISLNSSARQCLISGIQADPTHFTSGQITLDNAQTVVGQRTVSGVGSGLPYVTNPDGTRTYHGGSTRPTSMQAGDFWVHDA